jgi:hypothetical protein
MKGNVRIISGVLLALVFNLAPFFSLYVIVSCHVSARLAARFR